MKRLAEFLKDESGATAIEYALVAMLVSMAIIVGARSIGSTLNGTFTNVSAGFH